MDKLPADSSGPLAFVPGNAVSQSPNLSQLLDVQMEQLSGMFAFVTTSGLGRL